MRRCMSVKFRRRVCQILRANTGNPRMCGSACRITSATLTCKWLARAVRVGSVGAPTWSQLATICNDTVTEKAPLEEGNRALLSHLPIFAFIATTDAGQDQVAAKDMIAKEISPVLCLLFFSSVNCHEHQAHLIAKDNLKMMQTVCDTLCSEAEVETVLYFSSLATIINTSRCNLRAIHMKWTELRGPASSMLHASKQPPKCLSGRWGTIDDTERFLLERPWADRVVVLEKVWCLRETAHKRRF